jgi:hypothetical protein
MSVSYRNISAPSGVTGCCNRVADFCNKPVEWMLRDWSNKPSRTVYIVRNPNDPLIEKRDTLEVATGGKKALRTLAGVIVWLLTRLTLIHPILKFIGRRNTEVKKAEAMINNPQNKSAENAFKHAVKTRVSAENQAKDAARPKERKRGIVEKFDEVLGYAAGRMAGKNVW